VSVDQYQTLKEEIVSRFIDSGRFAEAKARLEELIAQHEAQYGTDVDALPRNRIYGIRINLLHVLRHLEAVIDQSDPSFLIDLMDGSTPVIGRHSDIVRQALLYQVPGEA
jgi:hypothetical protein